MQPSALSRMFDRGASRYDLLVGLNPGYHAELRRAASDLAARIGPRDAPKAIDLACGSGASTRALLRALPGRPSVLGLDASAGMLAQAAGKRWPDGVRFAQAVAGLLDVTALEPGSWDGVFTAYLFRNLPEAGRDRALAEVYELLAPGGWLVVQDYSVAGDRWATLRWHLVCWLVIIPLGLVVDRNPGLYRYLWRSVLAFDDRQRFGDRLTVAGFTEVVHRTASGWQRGILHTFVARKPG